MSPEKAMKTVRGWKRLSCVDRLRELGVFIRKKRRLWQDLLVALHYLKEGYKKPAEGIFTSNCSDGTQENGSKLEKSIFR